MIEEQDLVRHAREQVEARRGFLVHLFVYILSNAGMFLINLLSRGRNGNWWFYWPMLGWGIGIAAHGFSVYGAFGLFGRDWEEREVKKIVDKERSRQDRV